MTTLHSIYPGRNVYDPYAGQVAFHVVGGGYDGNTSFQDISKNRTPIITEGTAQGLGAARSDSPFSAPVIGNANGLGRLRLSLSDERLMTPTNGVTVIDGWVKFPDNDLSVTLWFFHRPDYKGPFDVQGNNRQVTIGMKWYGGSGSVRTLQAFIASTYSDPVFHNQHADLYPAGGVTVTRPPSGWVYFWLLYDPQMPRDKVPCTLLVNGVQGGNPGWRDNRYFWGLQKSFANPNQTLSIGGPSDGDWRIYALRVTHARRPPEDHNNPWPVISGVTNWQGGAVGVQVAPGQQVLQKDESFIVPGGVTEVCAVCVGTKLTCAGKTLVAATWPVTGDGGGKGGDAGASSSGSYTTPGRGGLAFGGGPGPRPINHSYTTEGGGGGAGGYSGGGGHGSNASGATPKANGEGGGGGGGRSAGGRDGAAAGGGVGLQGEGASGLGDRRYISQGWDGKPIYDENICGSPPGPFYGGGEAGQPGNNLAWRNAIPVKPGDVLTCEYIGHTGNTGAARVIWGAGRSFPHNARDV